MSKVIGIDLGTTYSAVAFLDNGSPAVIPDARHGRTLPSVVGYTPSAVLVGEEAREMELAYPETTVKKIKRRMGTDYRFRAFEKEYTPEEVSAVILGRLKEQAETYLGESVTDAVITVPAYFNDNQRQATKNAGRLAGLNVLRILNEPTAASLAYGVRETDEMNIVIYDLGGGTFDVSVLAVGDGVFEVVATAGDNNLGGEDFNNRLCDWAIMKFKEETGLDVSVEPLAVVKINEAVEAAKIALSSEQTARVTVPFVTADETGPRHLDFEITRAEFEKMISDYVDRSLSLCRQAVADGGMEIGDIERVILVGGSSRIPLVQAGVEKLFGRKPDCSQNPDEVVALGAAIQGGIVQGDVSGIVLVDVTPMSLGIEVENGYFVPIIERNSPIPTSARRVFTTVADNQRSVDVQILQGESMYAKNNVSLGKFRLEGIRTATKGDPRIEVTFELDVNGILQVSAADMDTGSAQGITIVNHNRISEEEMQRLQKSHSDAFHGEIEKRGLLTQVLKMKTQAEVMLSRIENTVPPAYRRGMVQDELQSLSRSVARGVEELDIEVMRKTISRLEFIQSELSAGHASSEMIA